MRIAAGNININVIFCVKAIYQLLKIIHLLNLVENDIIWQMFWDNTAILYRAMLFRIFRKFALFSDLFPKLLILKERAIMEFYTAISYRTVILD